MLYVAEATNVVVLTTEHETDRLIQRLFGNANPRVPGGAQGMHLRRSHRDVRVQRLGLVAPAAGLILGVEDHLDGAG